MTVNILFVVGIGTGPATLAPVLSAVSKICWADTSRTLWSKALSIILIFCVGGINFPFLYYRKFH